MKRLMPSAAAALFAWLLLGMVISVSSRNLGPTAAHAAPCDPSPPYTVQSGNWHAGMYAFTDASLIGGVYGTVENYGPFVNNPNPGGGTVGWVGIGNFPALAQIGWLKKPTGSPQRATFIQAFTSGGFFIDIRNLSADSVGSYTSYGVEYNPSGNPYWKFKKNSSVIHSYYTSNFTPTNVQVDSEITNYGDQYPGDGSDWMSFSDLHKYHWGYWAEMNPTGQTVSTRAALDGPYYQTQFYTRDTYCN